MTSPGGPRSSFTYRQAKQTAGDRTLVELSFVITSGSAGSGVTVRTDDASPAAARLVATMTAHVDRRRKLDDPNPDLAVELLEVSLSGAASPVVLDAAAGGALDAIIDRYWA